MKVNAFPGIPYEIIIHTSDVRGAGTDADVFVALYNTCGEHTTQVSLCPLPAQRKNHFERGQVDTFIVEVKQTFAV